MTHVHKVLLECFGTANFGFMENACASITLQLDIWDRASCKQQFIHHGLSMFYLMDELCNTLAFEIVEVLFKRLELEHLIAPYGVLETLIILVILSRFFTSHRDLMRVIRSCETATDDNDIDIGRCIYRSFLLPRLAFARTFIIYEFAYDILALRFATLKKTPPRLNNHDVPTQSINKEQQQQLQSNPQQQHEQKNEPPLSQAPKQQQIQQQKKLPPQQRHEQKNEPPLSQAPKQQQIQQQKKLPPQQRHETQGPQIKFSTNQDWNAKQATTTKVQNWAMVVSGRDDTIARIAQPTLNTANTSMRVVFFVAKLRVRARRVCPRMCHQVAIVLIILRMRSLAQIGYLRLQRKLRKRERKEMERMQRLKDETLRSKMEHSRQTFRQTVLPHVMRVVRSKQEQKRKQLLATCCIYFYAVVFYVRLRARYLQRKSRAVVVHHSKHSIAGIIYFWRKLGRLHAIRHCILQDTRIMERLPLKLSCVRDDIQHRAVSNYLFGSPTSAGHTLYWQFRFALNLLTNIHPLCSEMLSYLQSQATTNASQQFIEQYKTLVQTLMDPFAQGVDQSHMLRMSGLAKHLAKAGFAKKELTLWLERDPALNVYNKCVPFFLLMLDIFTNMQKCFERITFAYETTLWTLYYAAPKTLSAAGCLVYQDCTRHYPRFNGILELCQQSRLADFVNNWLSDYYRILDLVSYLKLISTQSQFVAQIEQDKIQTAQQTKKQTPSATKTHSVSNDLRAKIRQRRIELRHK